MNPGKVLQKAVDLLNSGDDISAERLIHEVLDSCPDHEDGVYLLGTIEYGRKNFMRAMELLETVLARNPEHVSANINMGAVQNSFRKYQEAEKYYQRALKVKPDHFMGLNNLGKNYLDQNNFQEAEKLLTRSIEINPVCYFSHSNLAALLFKTNRQMEAFIEAVKAALIQLDPSVKLQQLYSGTDSDTRRQYERSLELLERLQGRQEVLSVCPPLFALCEMNVLEKLKNDIVDLLCDEKTEEKYYPSMLLTLQSFPDISPGTMLQAHEVWGKKITAELARFADPYTFTERRTEQGKIRIGYLSPDFRNHSVGFFIKNIIASHDNDRFEVYCYSSSGKTDDLTQYIQERSTSYRDVSGMFFTELADTIKNDDIDVLVDLSGHTEGNMMAVMALRPAPVQMTYLGYPNTTGLDAVDYRITDHYSEHEEGTQYTEELLYMPESFLCFGEFPEYERAQQPPSVQRGYVTFASFNNVRKLTTDTIRVWSQILNKVENARLLIKSRGLGEDVTRENILREFGKHGIDESALVLVDSVKTREQHMQLYNEVDVALDTFPYNGTTTTCESLWMGVPVLTLKGKVHAQRVGHSILRNIGLGETVAETEREYIEKAIRLANSPGALKSLRSRAADAIRASILCKPDVFTRQLEELYHAVLPASADEAGIADTHIPEIMPDPGPVAEGINRPDYPDIKTLVSFLAPRNAYRPVILSKREVFCGPDAVDDPGEDRTSVRTPAGDYDIATVLDKLPQEQHPELFVVKADSTGRNFPRNLGVLDCPKVLILGNTQHLEAPIRKMLEYAAAEPFDFIISDHKRHHLHYFAEAGHNNVYWLPGLNNFPHEQPENRQKDNIIAFVGQAGRWHPYRKYILDYLSQQDIPLERFQLPQAQAARQYAKSLINLNVSLNADMNLRIFEVLSSGGFLVTDRLSPESGMEMLFQDGKHLVCFDDERDLLEKIRYYLGNPESANAIARQGADEYWQKHTPEQKVREFMDIVVNDNPNPLYRIDRDKRSIYLCSSHNDELEHRTALYEYLQELHLNRKSVNLLFMEQADLRLMCDLVDLPRTNITLLPGQDDITAATRQLLAETEISDRVRILSTQDLAGNEGTWDAVVIPRYVNTTGALEIINYTQAVQRYIATDTNDDPDIAVMELLDEWGYQLEPGTGCVYTLRDRGMFGQWLLSHDRIQDASGYLQRLLEHEPANVTALVSLAEIVYQQGNTALAQQLFYQAASLDRRNIRALNGLASIYEQAGQFGEAAVLYGELVHAVPDATEILNRLGYCYIETGQVEKAATTYQQSLAVNPAQQDVRSVFDEISKHRRAETVEQPLPPSRVLVINNIFPPQELGGYGRLMDDFSRLLRENNHQVRVLTSDTPYLGELPDNEQDIDRCLELFGGWKDGQIYSEDNATVTAVVRRNQQRIKQTIKQHQPDVCLLGNIDLLGHWLIELLTDNGIPIIHHLGNRMPGYLREDTPTSDLYHIATCSDWLGKVLLDDGYPLHNRISTVYPGAMVDIFRMAIQPARDKLRIAYASLVMPFKGATTLVEALKILHQVGLDFECTIAGGSTDENYVRQLKKFIQDHGMQDRIHFAGFLNRDELQSLYATHNVLVFPTNVDEGFGISQVEAMAAGLTVISTGTGGASEVVVHEDTGLLFPPGDSKQLAIALASLHKDPEHWGQLASRGQQRAISRFDIRRSVAQMQQTFADLLQRTRGA